MLKPLIVAGLGLATCLTATTDAFAEKGDWLVRARGIVITPDESATTSIGGDADIDSAVVPELDFTYFVADKWAVELILATAKHDVAAIGTDVGDVDLGDVMLLPPTLTLQYHPLAGEKFSPYVGAGVNLTLFYNDDVPTTGPVNAIDYDTSIGFALQAGADFMIDDKWFFNVDAKKLFLNTDVEIDTALGLVTADVDIDPWVFGVGFGYKF